MRAEYARNLELLAELATRDVAAQRGYPRLPELLRDLLRITRREATRRVEHARALSPSTGVSGAALPPKLPATAEAARAGVLGVEHIDLIHKTLTALPDTVTMEDRQSAERILVHAAQTLDAGALARVGRELHARLDPDGRQPSDSERVYPARELHLARLRDGRLAGKFSLDAEAGALLEALLSPLAKPHPSSQTGPDPRTLGERQGDALADLLHLAASSDDLPTEAGERPQVVLTMTLDQLFGDLGPVLLDGGTALDTATARRLACDARIIPAVLGSASEPLDLGRASPTVSQAQRRALILRDRGCAFPSCERPARHCHAHHVIPWSQGGPTDLNNLVLLCGLHHRLIHHSEWQVQIVDGQPRFTPPAFIDPHRRWRRNVLHRRIA